VLYAVLESVRLVAYLLSPIIPNVSSDIYKQLGFPTDFNENTNFSCRAYSIHANLGILSVNQKLGEPRPFFQLRIATVGLILDMSKLVIARLRSL